MMKPIRRKTMVELKAAIYRVQGWRRAAGESMAERITPLYDVTIDYQRGDFVATPKQAAKDRRGVCQCRLNE